MTNAELARLKVVRCFERYTSEQRAGMASSHRLGQYQRHATGRFYWITELVPGRAFDTRGEAIRAALAVLGESPAK